uniref:Helicase C-terminal domain-containing protein n=1 Tax=viral metagenome TaxID=1070528 RepID=A0A6C0F0B4_9ZZZZ
MYTLPNRKAFSDSVTRIFLKYRQKDMVGTDEPTKDLKAYQKLVRDYLLIETPYRGLLLYHGLGSGKTRSAIAIAESLLTTKKIYVLTPASLEDNFLEEIRVAGDPVYVRDQYWERKSLKSQEDRDIAKAMGISDKFLDTNGVYFTTVPGMAPNYSVLSKPDANLVTAQIDDIIHQRFNFIRYNGINKTNIETLFPSPQMFDDSVVIIEEAHNLIGAVVNESELKTRVYDYIYKAKNCKVVALSGTPAINSPHEIAYLMNLLRGPIERVSVPTKAAMAWDEALMTAFFRGQKDVDTVEYNSVKRTLMITRNPPYFESVFNEKGDRIAVKYNRDFKQDPDITHWVSSWKTEFETKFNGVELEVPEKYIVENLECLPTDFEEFMKTFVDGLNIRNPLLLGRRIQGLVSYYKGADEKLLPKRLDEDKTLQKIEMSPEQFFLYLKDRYEEYKQEANRKRKVGLNDQLGSFRPRTRQVCNYSIPPELRVTLNEEGVVDEDNEPDNSELITKLRAEPEKYLKGDGLARYSPKMARMLVDLKQSVGTFGALNNQFVYSEYVSVGGLGTFMAVLDNNGFQEYKVIKDGGIWKEDPAMKPDVPAYALYTGGASAKDKELREIYRQIFNKKYSDTFPQSLKDSLEGKPKRLCILMASKAGAEGITLLETRNVYILEPYWNPSRIDQVIGRAIRLNSHINLPVEDQNVTVKLYLSVFTPEQSTTSDADKAPNIVAIRRNDMVLKRYEGDEPRETFMTTDEYLYEVSYEKNRLIKSISTILKQAAVDCEIHRKLHSKEQPVIQCMRFDTKTTSEDLAYKPSYLSDEKDTLYMRNIERKTRKIQIIRVKGLLMILDPITNEIFDYGAFSDNKRLFRIGERSGPTKITFFPYVDL